MRPSERSTPSGSETPPEKPDGETGASIPDGVPVPHIDGGKNFSPEVPYMFRYFSGRYDAGGTLAQVDQDFIASISRDEAEEYAADHRQQYDVAMSRAVANLNVLCELALPLVRVGGRFLAMKSVSSDGEIDGARGAIGQLGGRIADIRDYTVPETQVRHRLVTIEKIKDTPAIYPRSFARIKKAPLK